MIYICQNLNCKKEIKDFPHRKRKYCSWKCSGEGRKIIYKGKNHPRYGIKFKRSKPAWNKGTHLSEERKQEISAKVLQNVYSLSEQERKEKYGKQNKGRIPTQEQLRKQSISMSNTIKTKGRKGAHVSESEIMWGKKIEKIFSIKLTSSKWIEGKCFDYLYKNYLIEIDGERWHRTEEQLRNDQLKNKIAEEKGFTLVRFNVNEIKQVDSSIKRDFDRLKEIFYVNRENVDEYQ